VDFTGHSCWSRSIRHRWFWLKQVFVTGQFCFTEKVEENNADTAKCPPAASWSQAAIFTTSQSAVTL